jgi:hypothetical protein
MGTSDLKHRLIAELKEISSELGSVPTRDVYRKHTKIGEKAYRQVFGGWTPFVLAAGLKVYVKPGDNNAAFMASVDSIKLNKEIRKPSLGVSGKILVLGDTHFPWVSAGALEAIYQYVAANPDITHVVQVGDLYDMYSWAKFPRSHMLYTPKDEIQLARKMAEEMWAKLRSMLPSAQFYQLLGNHDARPLKKVAELAPEVEIFVEMARWYEFEGLKTISDPREWLVIDGVHFTHGHLTGLGTHAKRYLRSVVCGHTHTGGVFYTQLEEGRVVFELNVGYLGDPGTKPLSYTATKLVNWTVGFGVIDQYGPRFIPL